MNAFAVEPDGFQPATQSNRAVIAVIFSAERFIVFASCLWRARLY